MTADYFLDIARKITQKYIKDFGASFEYIDDLDKIICDALKESYREGLRDMMKAEGEL